MPKGGRKGGPGTVRILDLLLTRLFSTFIRRWRLAIRSRTGRTSACRVVRPRNSSTLIVAKRSAPTTPLRPQDGGSAFHRPQGRPDESAVHRVERPGRRAVRARHGGYNEDSARHAAGHVGSDTRRSRAGHHSGARLAISRRKTNKLPSAPSGRSSGAASSSTLIERCSVESAVHFQVEPVRPLDAGHLATADLIGEAPPLVTIVTREDRVRKNAEALGCSVE